jgi:glucose/arabinose dehydrogenase
VRRVPLLLALVAGALLGSLPGLAPPSAEGAPALAQVGTFTRPVYVVAPPLDTRDVYVVERGGTVRLLVDGVRRGTPFLDIRNLVQTSDSREDERGLLSIAFAPDYVQSGRFYAYYTSRKPPAARAGDVVIDEFRRSAANPEVADPATRRTLVAIDHDDYQNHNGGQLAFGPDGMLYAGTGDGGGGGDPLGSGQSTGSLLGKVLRLDVRPGAALALADNPFGAAGPQAWAMGFRNPFRFSFDRLTGDLAIGDVGQDEVEEIDFVTKAAGLGRGGNFGWNILEGSNRYSADRPARSDEFPAGYIAPLIEHAHSSGWCSITGGYVMRDPALPELYGRYVYGDYCRGELWSAVLAPSGATGDGPTGLRVTGLSSLGEDGCGRLYATSIDGPVYRLATTGACAGPAPVPFPAPQGPTGTPSGPGGRPKVKLRVPKRQKVLRAGYVLLAPRCNKICRITATGNLLLGKGNEPKLQRVRRTLAANARVTLKVPVPLPARRLLRARLAARPVALARMTVTATDVSGKKRVVRTLVIIAG